MRLRKSFAALSMAVLLPLTACGVAATGDDTSTASDSAATTTTTTSGSSGSQAAPAQGEAPPEGGAPGGGGGPGGIDPSSVTTEDQLVELIQSAYGEASLGLHRGHQPIESVLDEVLSISHEELHVRMEEQGQNLATVAEDIGVDPQTLIGALVDYYSPAIDTLLADGTITQDEADQYEAALEEAFTYRVTWDGEAETPTFSGLAT